MDFKDLKVGDCVYILENAGTFVKTNAYNEGTVVTIGQPYEDMKTGNAYLSNILKNKLIDITISCNGVQKKLTVNADKNIMTDLVIGLTIATDKKDLITQITQQYKECEAKIASIEYYKREADKCRTILDQIKNNQQQIVTNDSIRVD